MSRRALRPAQTAIAAAEAAVLEARRELIRTALRANGGNRSAAAGAMGISRRHLHRRIKALDMVAELDALALQEGWLKGGGSADRALRGMARARGVG